MLEVVNAAYKLVQCYDVVTQQVVVVPYYFAYQCNDGKVYDIETLVSCLGDNYGLTTLSYMFMSADGKSYSEGRIPAIKTVIDNYPCYYKGVLEVKFDAITENSFIASLQRVSNTYKGDNILWDVAHNTYSQLAQVENTTEASEKSKTRKKSTKAQNKPKAEVNTTASKVEEEEVTTSVVEEVKKEVTTNIEKNTTDITEVDCDPTSNEEVKDEVKEEVQQDNTPTAGTEETSKKAKKTTSFDELSASAEENSSIETMEEDHSQETELEMPKASSEERKQQFQEFLDEMECSLEDIDEEEAAKSESKEDKQEQAVEPEQEEVGGKVLEEEDNVGEQVEVEVSTSKVNAEFEDRMIYDCTDEEIQQQLEMFSTENNVINFKPRVRMHKGLVTKLQEDEVTNLYYNTKEGIVNYDYKQEDINELRLHFGKCNYPLKVIFDAFTLNELLGMLHFEILDESPNDLYDGIYRALYLYKLYNANHGMSENMIQAYIIVKLTYLSTMTQAAIALEEAVAESEDSDNFSLKEAKIVLVNDLLSETNGYFRTFIADEILNVTYADETGKEMSKLDYIRFLCQLGCKDRFLPLKDSYFTKLVGFKDMRIQVNPKSIIFYSGNIELCPNAVGLMYITYLLNINRYIEEKVLTTYNVEDIPKHVLLEGVNYNEMLDDLKTSEDFKHITKMTEYEYLTEVNKMNLKILYGIIPQIRGKVVPKILGYICVNTEDIDANRKYFMPFIGKSLSQLSDLQVTFAVPVEIQHKLFKGEDLYFFKTDKAFLAANNITLKAVSVEFDEKFSLDSLVGSINNVTEFRTTVLPKFIRNTEESTLNGYKALGLYNPII